MAENIREHWRRDLVAAIIGALAGFAGSEQYGDRAPENSLQRISREHERLFARVENYSERLARIEELLQVVREEVRLARQRELQERRR